MEDNILKANLPSFKPQEMKREDSGYSSDEEEGPGNVKKENILK